MSETTELWTSVVSALGSGLAGIGVVVAAWQLGLSKEQAQTAFEDQLVHDCREVLQRLPLKALLGEPLTDAEMAQAMPDFHAYFDLSNAQAKLAREKRLREKSWASWRRRILEYLRTPAFQQAWRELSKRSPGHFNALRQVLEERH